VLTNSAERAAPVSQKQSEQSSYKASADMQVVAETDEPFVPVPDELIVNLKESREAVEALLDNLANTFAATTSVSTNSVLSCFEHMYLPMARYYKLDAAPYTSLTAVSVSSMSCFGVLWLINFSGIAVLALPSMQCFLCVSCNAASSKLPYLPWCIAVHARHVMADLEGRVALRAFACCLSCGASNRQQATTIPDLCPMCMLATNKALLTGPHYWPSNNGL